MSAWSQLEQMLTCAICLDKFKNPRLLPCQHSFCGDACMEGLVDYARRQIKCPECRAEHRIPYQGVASLPSNVTLIRFLELHSRITGEEPEPVPTFMEKCSVCGEKVEGVQRCWHCEKKVCPECKEAHLDLLRREISRLNNQSRRCFGKLKEFDDTLDKAQERLSANKKSILREIEGSIERLIEDLQAKQKKLCVEVETFAEGEEKLLKRLKDSVKDELSILETNLKLADEKVNGDKKYAWTDRELNEMKEIYARTMEFVRLFDPEVGDYTRKIRFSLLPDFEVMRRRICEIGELKFSETAASLMANSFQYANAVGPVAFEVCQAFGPQQTGGYSLSQSNSNTNLGSTSTMLELPSMQNSLMRSQSDHRLASQFQQRLKQQQQQQQQQEVTGRYGSRLNDRDQEMDALRSRYAPPGRSIGGVKSDYANDLLTRDWPRPTDTDSDSLPFGSSIQFKSAFMRRKEKERAGAGGYSGQTSYSAVASNIDEDEDLASEASYGGASGRNVRFFDQQQVSGQMGAQQARLFDFKDAQRAPFSGVPKLEDNPVVLERLHQMGARAIVDKKLAEEEGKRDKDLVESARQAMAKASERTKLGTRQPSEDEIERQKRSNKGLQQHESRDRSGTLTTSSDQESSQVAAVQPQPQSQTRSQFQDTVAMTVSNNDMTPSVVPTSTPTTITTSTSTAGTTTNNSPPVTSTVTGGRRGLYGAAVTEKSRRQLSDAIQDAATMVRRRGSRSGTIDTEPNSAEISAATSSSTTPKKSLRSSGRSMSRQSSADNNSAESGPSTPKMTRRSRLSKVDSSQSSLNEPQQVEPKNSNAGSAQSSFSTTGETGGRPTGLVSSPERRDSPPTTRSRYELATSTTTPTTTTTNTTEDNDTDNNNERVSKRDPVESDRASNSDSRQSQEESDNETNQEAGSSYSSRHRASREFLPNSVNKLLDRSAQIRRDSQEQRSRADSPQRTRPSYSRSNTSYRNEEEAPVTTNNSSNSIYTTASSGSRISGSSKTGSVEEQDTQSSTSSGRRLSGNSTDRTLVQTPSLSYRRDSADSQHSSSGYQSRFLSRSRTSAALSNSGSSSSRAGSLRDQQQESNDELTPRSYLSSRDRFMQSASVLGTSGQSSTSVAPSYSTGSTSGRTSHQAGSAWTNYSSPRRNSNSSPFLDTDDDEDDFYSAFLPSSAINRSSRFLSSSGNARQTSKSDYLRNKYASSKLNSSNSSGNSSSYLYRSRGSYANIKQPSRENSPTSDNDEEPAITSIQERPFGRRRSSLAGLELGVASRYLSKSRMLFKIGSRGADSSNFTWPRGVALGMGSRGREIVVADSSNHRVQIFTVDGHFINEFGSYGSDEGQFDCLAGVAINRLNRSYIVSDRYNHRIQVFDFSGRFVRAFGEHGREPGQFNLPWGVACDQSSGLIYVCDKENHRVQVFDVEGQHITKFGLTGSQVGQLQHPHYIAALSGKVVVTDTNNHRVQIFDGQTGRVLTTFGKEGSEEGQFKFPRGVAVDESGCIIVGDSGNNRLQVFTPEGVFVKSIGTWGSGDGEFKGIEGVAVDSSNNNIFVCDRENHRIQVF